MVCEISEAGRSGDMSSYTQNRLSLPCCNLTACARRATFTQMAAGTFLKTRMREFEKRCVIRILRKTGGNIRQAALLIDERRSRLYRILKRHGLKPADFRHANPR